MQRTMESLGRFAKGDDRAGERSSDLTSVMTEAPQRFSDLTTTAMELRADLVKQNKHQVSRYHCHPGAAPS
jgi:proteasome lid subunit RPN8/RPN11